VSEPKLIYLEWWDAIQLEGLNLGADPRATLFKGYTTLISQSDDEVVVAQFITDDGAFFDRVAIPRTSVVCLDVVEGVRKGSEQGR